MADPRFCNPCIQMARNHPGGAEIEITIVSYVGVVGSGEGAIDVTALGDVPNVAARLASLAALGEVILSESSRSAARLGVQDLEQHRRSLKGRSQPVQTYTLWAAAQ